MGIKIKITKNGELKMFRRGEWRHMYCPHDACLCGDTCPMFFYKEIIMPGYNGDNVSKELFLCKTRYLIEEVEWEK